MSAREFSLLGAAAILLAIVTLTMGVSGDARAQGPAATQASDGGIRKEGATYLNEAFEAYDALGRLDRLATGAAGSEESAKAAAEWSAAVDAAVQLTDHFGENLYGAGDGEFVTVRNEVQRRVMSWPKAGFSAYARRVGPAASARLEAGLASNDIDTLVRVAELFYPTTEAADAIERAVALSLEDGDFSFARQWLTRLVADHPLRADRHERWRALLAAADEIGRTAAGDESIFGGNITLARDAQRRDYRVSRALPEAMLWKATELQGTTLLEVGGGDPLNDPSSANARALLGGRLNAFEPIVAGGNVIIHDHRTTWAIDPERPDQPSWEYSLAAHKDDPSAPGQPWVSEDEPPPQFTSTAWGGRVFVHLERRPPDRFGADPSHPPASVMACLDLASGRSIWTTDLASWAIEFEEAKLDGAPIVVRDKVVAVARRRKPFGFEACYLIGMGLEDGRILFATHLGEAATGGLGYRRATITHPSADGDLIFVHTNLGTIAAVSASSGAVWWLREYEPSGGASTTGAGVSRGGPQARSWQYQPSMVWRDCVVAAPLDSDQVFVADQVSGRIVAEIPAAELKNPDMLIGIRGDRLYCVGTSVVCFDLAKKRVVWDRVLPDGELSGRAAISSEGVFVPTTNALLQFPLDGGSPRVNAWTVPAGGNIVITSGERSRGSESLGECEDESKERSAKEVPAWPDEVLVATPLGVCGLARRDDAFSHFRAAMAARPLDPLAALALADLALGARDFKSGLAALGDALSRAGGPANLDDVVLRRRLFTAYISYGDALRGEPSHGREAIEAFKRAGEIALEPADQVAFRRRLAAAHARQSEFAEAVAVWQQILADASLMNVHVSEEPAATPAARGNRNDGETDTAATAAGDAPSETAGELAQREIGRLITEQGPGVYSAIDREAELRLAAARQSRDVATLLRIAEMYPNSRVSGTARLERAEILLAANRSAEAAAALRAALESGVGIDRPAVMLKLIECLLKGEMREAALAWLDRAVRVYPDYRWGTADPRTGFAAYRKSVRAASPGPRSLPDPGTAFRPGFERVFGESPVVLRPQDGSPASAWDAVLVYADGKLDAIGARDGEGLWPEAVSCRMPPTLLGVDERHYLVATRHQVMALDRRSGGVEWKLGEYPADADAPGVDPEWIAAWAFHAVTNDWLYSALDRNEIVCANRSDGAIRWRVPTTQKVAADLVAADTFAAYVTRDGRGNGVVLLSAERGQVRGTFAMPDDRTIQRLMPTVDGDGLIVLSSREVMSIDPRDGSLRWRTPAGGRLISRTACMDSEALYVGTDERRITAFRLDSGRVAWVVPMVDGVGDANLWMAPSADLVYAAGPGALLAIDAFGGELVWSKSGGMLSDDPLDPSPPELTELGVLIVGQNAFPLTKPARGAKEKEYAARIFTNQPPGPTDKMARVVVRLGVCPQLRGVFAYNGAVVVVDGSKLIGYVSTTTTRPKDAEP